MVRLAVAASLLALAAAPAAAARGLAPLTPRHEGPLVSLVTVSPPPSIARIHPMRWSHWGREARALTAATLASFHGEALIGLRSVRDRTGVERDYGLGQAELVPGVRALDALADDAALRALLTRGHADARIRYVAPNARVEPLHARNDPLTTQINTDIGLPYEWQFAATREDLALNLSHGSPQILIGDVDGGIADVPDLAGKIAERWYTTGLTDASDPGGHGTAVASLMAANVDDGYGMAGFGGDSRLIMFRTQYDNASVASGITMLVARGVRVINLSLGAYAQAPIITDAVQKAISAGVLLVAAVGNDSRSMIAYPAQLLQPGGGGPSYGLAVGSDNSNGTLSYFSNFGQNLSLVAPGSFNNAVSCSGVFTAIPTPATDFDRNCFPLYQSADGARYVNAAGTSFSSPEVAGVAALIWAAKPDLTNSQVASIIKDSASRPEGVGWTPLLGWGLLDAAHALEEATGKSSADRIALSLSAAPSVDPGARLTESARATWADDGSSIRSLDVTCNATVAGKALQVAAQGYANGSATCAWDIPAGDGGRKVTGGVGVADEIDGATATAPFQAAVADKEAPTISAQPSSGRWGQKVALQYVDADDSGSAAVHVVVFAGSTVVAHQSTGQRPAASGSVKWPAPHARDGRGYHFCVTATDRAGNKSAPSCAQIALS
jgi:subtilisin family serine protease